MKFKTLYNRLELRDKPFVFTKPSMTIQEPKEDCDINHIVELYCGINPRVNPLLQQPFFEGEDTADMPTTLLEAYEITEDINGRFMQLPSDVRRELGDSPVNMLKWISDPNNKQRGEQLGIFRQSSNANSQGVGNSVAAAEHLPVNTPQVNNNPVTE